MDPLSFIAIIGTIASIVGAIFSFWQAKKSKKSAIEASQVKSQLLHHRKTSELAQLLALCRKVQKIMVKYGPASTQNSLQGIVPDNDAKEVQDFILLLKENRSYFQKKQTNDADTFCEDMNTLISTFVQSGDKENLRRVGTEMLFKINTMLSIIKKKLDYKGSIRNFLTENWR